ncbi:hypothetical protein DFJ58DRAFT_845966 [Suillus subalutaceus]|uniref:uncharacterized protein n=1 Tax=Suillus subalutaceus TaxID=48586 RepID=UPI001B86F7F1|nr:uncharacterized protein DFJ58DRAFT_845966 [Suillus subalutaceus]KAG1838738.1 hypothetical protein DFJ58DRAFT_845966 [Suillus subalutaceus]
MSQKYGFKLEKRRLDHERSRYNELSARDKRTPHHPPGQPPSSTLDPAPKTREDFGGRDKQKRSAFDFAVWKDKGMGKLSTKGQLALGGGTNEKDARMGAWLLKNAEGYICKRVICPIANFGQFQQWHCYRDTSKAEQHAVTSLVISLVLEAPGDMKINWRCHTGCERLFCPRNTWWTSITPCNTQGEQLDYGLLVGKKTVPMLAKPHARQVALFQIHPQEGFHGLCGLLPSVSASSLEMDDIVEDITAEQETLVESKSTDGMIDFAKLQSTLMDASKGVTEGMDSEYKRQMNQAVVFLTGMHLLHKDKVFFCKRPRADTPWLIVAWIMNSCDSINIDGTQKPSSEEHGMYSHAQKMRASMTYAFGRLQGLGNMWWHESDVGGGIMPELLNTWDILLKFYHNNHLNENWAIHPYQPGERLSLHCWGGGHAQRLLQATYTIMFVLKIQAHDFRVYKKGVTLHLPFHKTHQNGDIKPFHLWVFPPHEAHICPVRTLTAWLGDCVVEADTPMASEQFLELFRNNLLDIGIDPAPYGTHSFLTRRLPVPTYRKALGTKEDL